MGTKHKKLIEGRMEGRREEENKKKSEKKKEMGGRNERKKKKRKAQKIKEFINKQKKC